MCSFNAVQCVPVYYMFFVILCQICYAEGYVKINNVFSDGKVETQILHSVDPFALDASNLWEKQVKFVTKNTIEETEEEHYNERNLFGNWIVNGWNKNREVRQINQPSNQIRVSRQSNPGYSPLYPNLPTTGSYGNYGSYSYNNGTNFNRPPPSNGLNTTFPTRYPHSSNSNFTLNGYNNPYRYNSPNSTHNGMNSSYPQNTNTFKPGASNGTFQYNRPSMSYNNSGNSYFPQPANRPYYPGAANNSTNFGYQRTTAPFYPATTNYGTNPNYPQSPNRPFSPASNNHTFPGPAYPLPPGNSFYPGAVNNTKYPSYPTPTRRPLYPGATNNGTNPSYPHTGNRPFYPGSYFNGTNPYYPQQPNRPLYPDPTNKSMHHTYPPSPSPINHHNSIPSFNNSRLPTFNFTNSSPYNSQSGYPMYNINGTSQGTTQPGPVQPFYNNSGLYNSGSQGSNNNPQAHNIPNQYPTNNLNWNYPQPKPYNYTNVYTPTSQNFSNIPINPHSGNFSPNQYNAALEKSNFFYPTPNSLPIYDPRKNPPNQFSYNH